MQARRISCLAEVQSLLPCRPAGRARVTDEHLF
jgi:hypothetical protein